MKDGYQKHSANMIKRWQDPIERKRLQQLQSAGTSASWADPERKKARLEAKHANARARGYLDYGHYMSMRMAKAMADRCGVPVDFYYSLSANERRVLRVEKGLIPDRKRGKKNR